jgi:Zn-dependent protease
MDDILHYLPFFLVFVLCGSVHEFCHAWSAFRLGDSTARDLGRMTLNPLAHVDLMGTVLVPVITMYAAGIPFGWMKPVPVSLMNLRRPRRDSLLVSLAGPFSNLFMAFLGFIALLSIDSPPQALRFWVLINLLLAYLNLLPIPPLDGSSIVDYLLKSRTGRFHAQGYLGLIFLVFMFTVGFRWLSIAALETYHFMLSVSFVPVMIFVVLFVLGGVFLRISSSKPQKREITRSMQIYRAAEALGRKLARGAALDPREQRWLEGLRSDRGDGQTLCAPVSFGAENEFCDACPNFNRCASRLVDMLENKEVPQ